MLGLARWRRRCSDGARTHERRPGGSPARADDVKYVMIGVDVKAGGTKVSEVHVDPWLLGGGLAFRF
jgi:hypothetical protein